VKPPEDRPRGLPRDPDPYVAFDESQGPTLPRRRRKAQAQARISPLNVFLLLMLALAVMVWLVQRL
jgi:hypothetical protein